MLRGSPLGGEWSCVAPEPRCLKYHSCHEAWRGVMLRFGVLICVCLFFLGCALLFAFGSAGSPCFFPHVARSCQYNFTGVLHPEETSRKAPSRLPNPSGVPAVCGPLATNPCWQPKTSSVKNDHGWTFQPGRRMEIHEWSPAG